MLLLLVAITVLENFEALEAAVCVLNADSVLRQTAVERFLLISKLAALRLLERRYTE